MQSQRDKPQETPTLITDAPILEYYGAKDSRPKVQLRVPDCIPSAVFGSIAIALGWCTWLSITQPVRDFYCELDFFDDPVERLWTTRDVSVMFFAITCCACCSARAYWIRWKQGEPDFWKQISELDEAPLALRLEDRPRKGRPSWHDAFVVLVLAIILDSAIALAVTGEALRYNVVGLAWVVLTLWIGVSVGIVCLGKFRGMKHSHIVAMVIPIISLACYEVIGHYLFGWMGL